MRVIVTRKRMVHPFARREHGDFGPGARMSSRLMSWSRRHSQKRKLFQVVRCFKFGIYRLKGFYAGK